MGSFYFAEGQLTGKVFYRILLRCLPSALTKGFFPGKCNTHVGLFDLSPFFSHLYLKQMGFFFVCK